jgi:RNA polymerase sigma-70 factor (ECF subfamily)
VGEATRQRSAKTSEPDQRRTATVERVPDPNSDEMEKLWDQEWRRNLLEASIVRVKKRVNAKQYQMFNLYVMMQWPMNQVKKTLGVSAAQVYMAKMRISRLIKSEIRTLERKIS